MAWTQPDNIVIPHGSSYDLIQSHLTNQWNIVVQPFPFSGNYWDGATCTVWTTIPDVKAGDVVELYASQGIKGATTFASPAAVVLGAYLCDPSVFGGPSTPHPPQSVGEDYRPIERPYVQLQDQQVYVASSDLGDQVAYTRVFASSASAPGYLQVMWPYGTLIVRRWRLT